LRPISELSVTEWHRTIDTNLTGAFYCCREALVRFAARGGGYIVNIGSLAGKNPFAGGAAYNASKFALEGLTEALVYELKPHGVQVALIEPGGFSTEFAKGSRVFGATSFAPSSHYLQRSEALSHFLTSNVKRLGNPERVSRLIVKSVERRWLPLRMMIGIDAWAMRTLGWLTPGWFKLGVIDRMFRFMIFKD
jgi:NAD(P)-dependent dehydrogenase (short-subunit alcohol dehydrogenase family)